MVFPCLSNGKGIPHEVRRAFVISVVYCGQIDLNAARRHGLKRRDDGLPVLIVALVKAQVRFSNRNRGSGRGGGGGGGGGVGGHTTRCTAPQSGSL